MQLPLALSLLFLAGLSPLPALSAKAASAEAETFVRFPKGIQVANRGGLLRLEARTDTIIRVSFAPEASFFERASLALVPPSGSPSVESGSDGKEAWLRTSALQARVDLATGAVRFLSLDGREIAAELPEGRELSPALVQGERTYHVRQRWREIKDEHLYGLGQRQLDFLDLKGHDLDLWQRNTHVVVPFLLSNKGYGVFWNNTSLTRFGDLRQYEPVPEPQLLDKNGKPGGLSVTYFGDARFEQRVDEGTAAGIAIDVRGLPEGVCNAQISPKLPAGDVSIRWEGYLQPELTGTHTLRTYSGGGLRLWVDGKLLIDHWRQEWLPDEEIVRVPLVAGKRHALRIDWVKDQKAAHLQLRWKTPSFDLSTSLWSEVGEGIDYFFVYGPQPAKVLAGYREITGRAPLMPQWAFGLWQSRQRYKTAQESLDVVKGFRSRKIPFDNIVQDWFYWKQDAWGSHLFDPERFPDPDAWIRELHAQHAHLMLSVWGKFYQGTDTFEELRKKGFIYQPNLDAKQKDWLGYVFTFYDAFNPEARKLYWSQIESRLFKKGVDAWWMDASEPDLLPLSVLEVQKERMNPNALGSGARALNAYSLVHAQAVYEGQRGAAPDQRVFNLTRSGFAGMQRYAAAVWSGDITSTWTALRKQIPAALGFTLSGMPYWTMDSGGFAVPQRFLHPSAEDAEEWRELNTRWFQFSTFVPLLRVHGEEPNREMWELGGEGHPAYAAHLKFDRLRYRLLPYIYSLAGAVTHENGTMLRPLVLDFPDDERAATITDQFLFGPAIMVSPVYSYRARERKVYLPATEGGWYEFWTGAWRAGGKQQASEAPYDTIPLHIRAGSIVPTGPELQYTGEKPANPLVVYVFAGADGSFSLYEDDGLTYGYERGAYSLIPLSWNDRTQTLRIGDRKGSFPGMLEKRRLQVVLIDRKSNTGFSFDPKPTAETTYSGQAVELRLR